MNKKIISILICIMMVFLSACGTKSRSNKDLKDKKDITVTDVLGREVTIKGPVEKVITFRSALRLYSYVGNTDKIIGMEDIDKKSAKGKPYMLANQFLVDLPSVGSSTAINYEKVIELKPDVIFICHDDKAFVENLYSKTDIPVVALDYGKESVFEETVYDSIKIIGKVMDEDKRANEVVEYMENCKKDLNDRTKDIPDDKKPSVYMGALAYMGPQGIESTKGNNPLLNALNAKNVADETGKNASIMVDKEKILQWNPDKIIIDSMGLQLVQQDYKKNPDFYKTLSAFKNEEVYIELPYNWYCTNNETAIADGYYVGKVLYPEQFKDINPEEKANEIYKFLLGKELYSQMAKDFYGGYKKITLEDLGKIDIPKKK